MRYLIILTMIVATSCTTTKSHYPRDPQVALLEAEDLLNLGEFYQAKQLTQHVLDSHPQDQEAQILMSEIIAAEVARQKAVFSGQEDPEEVLSERELEGQIKTTLERSRSLLQQGYYEEAVFAAEKVFMLDPDNLQASALIDEIRKQARLAGKTELGIMNKVSEDEIQARIERYKDEANKRIAAGRLSAARHSVEKILLLEPNDPEANKILTEILENQEASS